MLFQIRKTFVHLRMFLLPFWALNVSVALLSIQGQKALGFHQKYLNLCSEDEQRSYRFGATWGWVINDRIFNYPFNTFNSLNKSPGSPLSPFPPSRPSRPSRPWMPSNPGVPGTPLIQRAQGSLPSCSASSVSSSWETLSLAAIRTQSTAIHAGFIVRAMWSIYFEKWKNF